MKNPLVEQRVMDAIKTGDVHLRSKYVFLAEKLGVGSAFVLTILLAIICANFLLYYLKASDNLSYLSFGSPGILAFLESFPYLLVISFVVSMIVAGMLLKQSDVSYRQPFRYFVFGLLLAVFVVAILIPTAFVAERAEHVSDKPNWSGTVSRRMFHRGAVMRRHGVVGRVVAISPDVIRVQTPFGENQIDTRRLDPAIVDSVATGTFVMAVGHRKGDVFAATRLRLIDEEEAGIERQGVRRRFDADSVLFQKTQ